MPDTQIELQVVDFVFQKMVQLICIALVIFFSIRVADKGKDMGRPLGIWVWVIFLSSAALYNLISFRDYEYYRFMFHQLPEPVLSLRYGFSILFRCLILAAAAGLLYFKEWARKLVLAVAVFTIGTIYWKHPYYVFENIAIMIEQGYYGGSLEQLHYPAFPWITLFAYIMFDLLSAGLIIYYFTLTHIVSLFHSIGNYKRQMLLENSAYAAKKIRRPSFPQ